MLRITVNVNDYIRIEESIMVEHMVDNVRKRDEFLRSLKKTMRYLDMLYEKLRYLKDNESSFIDKHRKCKGYTDLFELTAMYLLRDNQIYLNDNKILDISLIPDSYRLVVPLYIEFTNHSSMSALRIFSDVTFTYIRRFKSTLHNIYDMVKNKKM